MTVVIDACSFIPFLASAEQDIVLNYAESLGADIAACDKVRAEIHGILTHEQKFQGTGGLERWKQIEAQITQLSDEVTESLGLAQAMADLHRADVGRSGSLEDRKRSTRDLGEFMSAAHALRLARQGTTVLVLVDDTYGRQLVSMAKLLLFREDLDYKLISKTSARSLIEQSKVEWRRDRLSPEQTIARMEKIEEIPRWN